ncbi:MAG: hypothetical protein ACKO96_22610 [Flammeovirgaceae bacterium]
MINISYILLYAVTTIAAQSTECPTKEPCVALSANAPKKLFAKSSIVFTVVALAVVGIVAIAIVACMFCCKGRFKIAVFKFEKVSSTILKGKRPINVVKEDQKH